MLNAMDRAYIGLRIKGRNFIDNLKNEERGDHTMVAVIALIAVVLVIAGIFSKQLTEMVTKVFDNVSKFLGGSDGTKMTKP